MIQVDDFSQQFNKFITRTYENWFINTRNELPEYPAEIDQTSPLLNMREFSVLIQHWERTLSKEHAAKEIAHYAVRKLLNYIHQQAETYDKNKTEIILDAAETSRTDGKVIRLTTSMFKNVGSDSLHDSAHTFIAHYFHELCHILYTDFKLHDSREYKRCMADAKAPVILKNILNVIEDERIENLFVRSKGWERNDLGVYNFWMKRFVLGGSFDKDIVCNRITKIEEKGGVSMLNQIRWEMLFMLVRFPDPTLLQCYIDWPGDIGMVADDFYKKYVNVVKDYSISTGGCLDSSKQAFELSVELDKLFDPLKENDTPKDFKEHMQEQASYGSSSSLNSKEEETMVLVAAFSKEEAEEIQQEVMEDLATPSPDPDCVEMVAATGTKFLKGCPRKPYRKELLETNVMYGIQYPWLKDAEATLKEIQQEVGKGYAPLRKLLTVKSQEHAELFKGFRNGKLDTTKLVPGLLGDQNIYYNKAVTQVNKLALVIIVDQSFSMQQDKKISKARKAMYTIGKAFEGVPSVDLFMYGYSSDVGSKRGTNEIYIYAEPGRKVDFNFIDSVTAQAENRDGTCYDEIMKRVERLTKNPVLCFIISDGNPAAYDYEGGVQHTKQIVEKWEKKGAFICQIAIDSSLSKAMYKYFVNFKESKNLANDIVKYIRAKVLKYLKPKVKYEC